LTKSPQRRPEYPRRLDVPGVASPAMDIVAVALAVVVFAALLATIELLDRV
jgi:hypothetical protein